MMLSAPAAAVAAGIVSEWLDFRALRYPLLLIVLVAVVATALAVDSRGRSARGLAVGDSLRTIAIGLVTWGAAESIYVAVHALRGEPFEAGRFGPQWAQAAGLIGVHALFLGMPTGVVAAMILRLRGRWLARP